MQKRNGLVLVIIVLGLVAIYLGYFAWSCTSSMHDDASHTIPSEGDGVVEQAVNNGQECIELEEELKNCRSKCSKEGHDKVSNELRECNENVNQLILPSIAKICAETDCLMEDETGPNGFTYLTGYLIEQEFEIPFARPQEEKTKICTTFVVTKESSLSEFYRSSEDEPVALKINIEQLPKYHKDRISQSTEINPTEIFVYHHESISSGDSMHDPCGSHFKVFPGN